MLMRSRLMRSSTRRTLSATTAIAGIGLAVAGPAWAGADEPAGIVRPPAANARITVFSKFEVKHSGQVMGISGGSTSNQARAIQAPFFGDLNQQWTRTPVSSTPANNNNANTPPFNLVDRKSGKCLDTANLGSLQAGAAVVQATCDGTISQRWYVHKQADDGLLTGKGYRFIFNDWSELVLDVSGASTSVGAPIIQWPAKSVFNGANQLWHEDIGGFA